MKVSATLLCSIAAWTLVVLMLINEYRNSKPVETTKESIVTPVLARPKIIESVPKIIRVTPPRDPEPVIPKPAGQLFEAERPKKVIEPKVVVPEPRVSASMPFERHVPSTSSKKQILNAESYHVGGRNGISWKEFLTYPRSVPTSVLDVPVPPSLKMNVCNREVVGNVTAPGLSEKDFEWCKWTLSDSGGKVKVGKSYGNLNGKDREKYEQLNCNSVLTGKNPSCDDSWGDNQMISWKKNEIPDVCGDSNTYSSKMHCFDSSSLARFCVFENAVFDFSKMHDVARPGRSTGSRKWDKGFLATDCDKKYSDINFYEFYSPSVDKENTKCNYVINETVLAYSHDNIFNLGHSMSDFMNVWAMLWLSGTGEYARDISFLNIDALRMGHSYKDEMNQFARHYELQFARILKAADFAHNQGTVCFKRLIFQSRPVILFTWDGWWQDMRCSFVGPSSLFQRWNLQIRNNYGLLQPDKIPTNDKISILLITRSIGKHSEGQASRVFRNTEAITTMLGQFEGVELVVKDLATMNFEEQIKLIASSSMIIGMHGAGIASSMHMAVGSKYCCGVIEIFPQGEFKPIRGYGNMARRMGHHYERLELSSKDSHGDGGEVPVDQLKDLTMSLLQKMEVKPSCMLPSVIEDPHFSSIPSAWGK